MRLVDKPPAGAWYSGWSSSPPTIGTSVEGVHNPKGDLQKISFGTIASFQDCTALSPTSGMFQCSSATQSNGEFMNITFSTGTVEPGSSGSGLFKTVSGVKYLIGQLYGGSSSCSKLSGTNYYGRFDTAYKNALSQWLDAGSKYILAVTKSGNGAGSVASPTSGIDCGLNCSATLAKATVVTLTATPSTGSIFSGWSGACSGPASVCTVTMNSAVNLTATFSVPYIPLNVALDNSSQIFANDVNSPWFGQSGVSNYGGSAVQTGQIGNSQSTTLSAVLQGPGTLTFDWKVSSEKGYDIFSARLDGNTIWSWSGITTWYNNSITIPAGSHTVQWTYTKDSALTSGNDAGWLDHVAYSPISLSNILQNPGFESGNVGWTQSASNGLQIITTYSASGSSSNKQYAWLCGYINCKDSIGQVVTIPSNATTAFVDFWAYISASVTSGYDTLVVWLADATSSVQLAVLKTLTNLGSSDAWYEYTIDVSKYTGKALWLMFTGTTGATSNSSFYVDDINLMTDGVAKQSVKMRSGVWWNPAENGRGYTIQVSGNILVFYTYLFDAVGNAMWYGGASTMNADGTFDVQLQEYAGGQSLLGTYRAPTVKGNITNAHLACSTPTTCNLTWAGGTVPIEKFQFGGVPKYANSPSSGLWWDPSASGRGYFVDVQGDTFAFYAYLFDQNGRATWYLSAGTLNADGSYDGQMQEYVGGQSLLSVYSKPPVAKGNVGSVHLKCPSTTSCQLTWPGGTIPIKTFLF